MKDDYLKIARAFDMIAADYDTVYGPETKQTGNAVMSWMRQESIKLLKSVFPPGSHLLEIGCGSGDEALALAASGRSILATDVSPAMVALTQKKARGYGIQDRLQTLILPAGSLQALKPKQPFDGAYASFGGLNCEPKLPQTAQALDYLIRSDGIVVLSVMGKLCLFEMLWYLLHGHPRQAIRRLKRGWQPAPVAGQAGREATVLTRYLGLREIRHVFSPTFTVKKVLALPLLFPPPYADVFFRRHQKLFMGLEPWEYWLRTRWPWCVLGDHLVVVLEHHSLLQKGHATFAKSLHPD